MTKRFIGLCLLSGALISGCATTTAPVPLKRSLDADMQRSMVSVPVVVSESDGVVAGWTSAAYAPNGSYASVPTYAIPPGVSPVAAGVGAGIGQAIAIAILDAAPSARARRSVEVINADVDKAALDAALVEKLRMAARSSDIQFGSVDVVEVDRRADPVDGQLSVKTRYALAEDATAVQVQATVEYYDSTVPYTTRYSFEKKPPRSERKGPHYRNTFTYHSDRFDAPELTDELRGTLVEALEEERKARIREANDDYAAAKAEGLSESKLAKAKKRAQKAIDSAEKAYTKGLKDAEDDKLSKTEKAVLIIGDWRGGSQGAPLDSALRDGQDFIARMLVADLADSRVAPMALPVLPKSGKERVALIEERNMGLLGLQDHEVIEEADGRKIIRITTGLTSGAYHSIPSSGTATYGNTFKVAD